MHCMCILYYTIQVHNTHVSPKTNFSPTLPIMSLRFDTLVKIFPFYKIHKKISNLAALLFNARAHQLNNCTLYSLAHKSLNSPEFCSGKTYVFLQMSSGTIPSFMSPLTSTLNGHDQPVHRILRHVQFVPKNFNFWFSP